MPLGQALLLSAFLPFLAVAVALLRTELMERVIDAASIYTAASVVFACARRR
jgi:hypothetical protein